MRRDRAMIDDQGVIDTYLEMINKQQTHEVEHLVLAITLMIDTGHDQ